MSQQSNVTMLLFVLLAACGGESGPPPQPPPAPAATRPPEANTSAPAPPTPPMPAASPPSPPPPAPPSPVGELVIKGPAEPHAGKAGDLVGGAGTTITLGQGFTPGTAKDAKRGVVSLRVGYTIAPATPGWANSPRNFTATAYLNNQEVGHTTWTEKNDQKKTAKSDIVIVSDQEVTLTPSPFAVFTFVVQGNWTARGDRPTNPADLLEMGDVLARVVYYP
jgi:hypothetical protein